MCLLQNVLKIKTSTKEKQESMSMIPHTEKTLVYLPEGHGDVYQKRWRETERQGEIEGRQKGKERGRSLTVCSFHFSKELIPPLHSFESRVESSVPVANIIRNSVFHKAEFMIN